MNGSKRKQLAVPMVALMVCAVAFIGIGYALTSSFVTTDNSIAGEKLEVTLDGVTGSSIFTQEDTKVPYATHRVNGSITHYSTEAVDLVSKKIIINDDSSNYSKYKINVTINSNGNNTICGMTPQISITNTTSSSGDIILEKTNANNAVLTITLPETESVSTSDAGENPFQVSGIIVTIEVTGIA